MDAATTSTSVRASVLVQNVYHGNEACEVAQSVVLPLLKAIAEDERLVTAQEGHSHPSNGLWEFV